LISSTTACDGRARTIIYPPYDIVRTGEEAYSITLAVAGFRPEEIAITAQQNMLTVTGRKAEKADRAYLYQGISERPFQRRFRLADYVEVTGATFDNGLLRIDLAREVPEAMKPRRIAIGSGVPKQISASRAA
jgi:molecular chaperone IbpA